MFSGFRIGAYDPASPDYWLDYWVHAFREIREHGDRCLLVLQDDLRAAPVETMTALCSVLDLDPGPVDFAAYFRSSADRTPTSTYNAALLEEATTLYLDLEGLAHGQLGQRRQRPDRSDEASAAGRDGHADLGQRGRNWLIIAS